MRSRGLPPKCADGASRDDLRCVAEMALRL